MAIKFNKWSRGFQGRNPTGQAGMEDVLLCKLPLKEAKDSTGYLPPAEPPLPWPCSAEGAAGLT